MRLTNVLLRRVAEWSTKYANLPEKYVKESSRMIEWQTPRKVQYLRRTVERKRFFFSVHRPWTNEFKFENTASRAKYVHVEPIKKWSFFRGDRVELLTGKDKGKQGIVCEIIQERNWITVYGLNTELKCIGKTKDFPGTYILEEKPLLVTTDVALVDPSDLRGTKIEWKYTAEGEHVRVSVRTGRIIPIPVSAYETIDYKSPELYKEQPKDTTKEDVQERTFKVQLKTFEMDIMDKMGLKEDRIPKKYYWY